MAAKGRERIERFLREYEALCRKHELFISCFPEPLDLCDFSEAIGDRDFVETLTELGADAKGGNDGG